MTPSLTKGIVVIALAISSGGVFAASDMALPDCRSFSYKIEISEAIPACALPGDRGTSVGVEGPVRTDEMTFSADGYRWESESPSMAQDFPGNTLTH